jgi:hypothetical protein
LRIDVAVEVERRKGAVNESGVDPIQKTVLQSMSKSKSARLWSDEVEEE